MNGHTSDRRDTLRREPVSASALSAAMELPEVRALVAALRIAIEVMEVVDGENDCSRGIDAAEDALAAIKETKT